MNRNLTKFSKKFTRLTLIFLLIGISISFSLWTNDRTFYKFPVFDFLKNCQYIDNYIVFAVLLSIIFTIIKPSKIGLASVISLIFTSILFDQVRVQPWVYFYLLLLIPFLFTKEEQEIKKCLQILFVGFYLWSGFHKINSHFRDIVFESILIDGLRIQSIQMIELLKQFYWIVPIIEILTGILFISLKTRKIGFFIGLTIHFFILYYVSFGLQGNWVIIPWNLMLIFGIYILFYKNHDSLQLPKNYALTSLLIISLVCFPLGYVSKKIDHSLSFGLYDGLLKNAYIIKKESTNNYKIHQELIDQGNIIDLNYWAFQELQVPFYPEERFLNSILQNHKYITILVTDSPLWKRNILGTYRSTETNKEFVKTKQIDQLIFKDSIYIGNYELICK